MGTKVVFIQKVDMDNKYLAQSLASTKCSSHARCCPVFAFNITGRHAFSVKGHRANISGFSGHKVSLTSI